MNSSPLKDARLRIELDTKDAQARLDALEEKMDHIGDEIKHGEDQIKDQTKRTNSIASKRLERDGKSVQGMSGTGPGKFGIRQIPNILTMENMAGTTAGIIAGLAPLPPAFAKAVEVVTRTGIALSEQYGAAGIGMARGILDTLDLPAGVDSVARQTLSGLEKMRKWETNADQKLKAVMPSIDQTIEMAKAQVLTGGHVSGNALKDFYATAYDWQFVNARKDKDIQDKTMKALGEEGGKVIAEFFMNAVKGKIVN